MNTIVATKREPQTRRKQYEPSLPLSGGSLGAGVVGLFELTSASRDSSWLTISVFCLTVAIPLLTYTVMELIVNKRDGLREYTNPKTIDVANKYGLLLLLFGVLSIAFHFSWLVGFAFVGSIVFIFAAIRTEDITKAKQGTQGGAQ